jgi:hypothetical protein
VGSPRFPGNPSCAFASVPDPGRIDDPSPIDGFIDAAPTRTTVKASAAWLYRGYRAASAPAADASRMVLPPSMQGSLPAGWLALTGREINPLDCDEVVSGHIIILHPWTFPGATSEKLHKTGNRRPIRSTGVGISFGRTRHSSAGGILSPSRSSIGTAGFSIFGTHIRSQDAKHQFCKGGRP